MNESVRIPYLSLVIASRNDDHGGDALRRTQVTFKSLLEQLEEHHIPSELILVDWNPPADRPLLKDIIIWPDKLKYCTIRVIVVPSSIHHRYEYSDRVGLHRTIAINSGIRRARGEFALPGAIDLIYSDELMSLISAKNLKDNESYRIDRIDVNANAVECGSLQDLLAYCKDNIVRIHTQGAPAKREKLPALHTNAAGDFQLMSRKSWGLVRGYRETNILPAYGDGLFCFVTYAAGLKEVVFKDPLRLYHINHSGKFNDRTQGSGLPFENLLKLPFLPVRYRRYITGAYRIMLTMFGYKFKGSVDGIPTLHFSQYRKMARDVVAGKRSYVMNDENWGLGNETLNEYTISKADWEEDSERD